MRSPEPRWHCCSQRAANPGPRTPRTLLRRPTKAADGGDDSSTYDNDILDADAPTVSIWGWYPNRGDVVDNFNALNDDVQICSTNVGQGGEEYDKFQTAVAASSGAPDVIMLEADRIQNYVVQGPLVAVSDYGYEDGRTTSASAPGRTCPSAMPCSALP